MATSRHRQAVVTGTMARAVARYRWARASAWLRSPERQAATQAEAHATTAREMAQAIREVGGLYIKVGQLVSVVGAWLPAPFRDELAMLQDEVPSRPSAEIKARIAAELGAPVEALFASFEEVPIAAASIGQVHRATLADGTAVVVKVQHASLEQTVAEDLVTLRWVFARLGRYYPNAGFAEMFTEVAAMVVQELDFAAEAANIAAFAQTFAGREDVVVPRVIAERSSARVLTLSYEAGEPLANCAALGLDPAQVARQLVGLYCEQLLGHGAYHADPHPGNLKVRVRRGRPQLVLLDFGAVAGVTPQTRQGLLRLLHGVATHDTTAVVDALRGLGFAAKRGAVTADGEIDEFHRVVARLHQQLQAQFESSPATVPELVQDPARLFAKLGDGAAWSAAWRELASVFHVPQAFIAMHRTLLLLFGVCREVAPGEAPAALLAPHVQRYLASHSTEWTGTVGALTKDLVLGLVAMPGQMKALTAQVEQLKAAQLSAARTAARTQTRHTYLSLAMALIATLVGAVALLR